MVCRRRARGFAWVVVGLSQTCERGSTGYGQAVADVRDGFHGVWTVCRRRVRGPLLGVVGLSHLCERDYRE